VVTSLSVSATCLTHNIIIISFLVFLQKFHCLPFNNVIVVNPCVMGLVLLTQVKLTKDHHLVTTAELESGKFDAVIKESFEPLMCSKHGEPLRLYCTEPSCSAPICTICKNTQGHDGHTAIELADQVVITSTVVRHYLH